MQHKPADTSRADRIANQNSRDAAINERLVAVIKANAQVVASDARPADRLERLGFLRQSLAPTPRWWETRPDRPRPPSNRRKWQICHLIIYNFAQADD